MRKVGILQVVLVLTAAANVLGAVVDLSNATVVVLNPKSRIHSNAADMLADEIEKRTRIDLEVATKMPSKGDIAIVIGTAGQLVGQLYKPPPGFEVPQKTDAYSIWVDIKKRAALTICLAGFDDRGTLFAAGRLLRILDMSRDKLSVDIGIKISTAPKYTLRGHQQAYRPKTNSYDGWTIDMWEQYYREMIVFGMNAIELLPPRTDDADDSPHFPKPKMEMMVTMSQLADDYGLDVWIWFPARDKHYTDKKVLDAAIKEWGDVFKKLPRLDAVFVPGGDPGHTHPTELLPFMEKQKKNLNKYHPKARIWMSPQGFDRFVDRGWMKAFLDILQNEQPAWLDGVVFGPQLCISLPKLRQEVPAMYPIRRYPDITHSGGGQYKLKDWDKAFHKTLGREPITYRPYGYARIFRDPQRYALGEKFRGLTPVVPRPDEDINVFIDPKQYSIGFITYSEGCNDDLNKVLWSCLGWDPETKVEDIVKEYSRFFIGKRYEESFSKGIFALEKNWIGPLKDNEGVYETLELFQEMERNATPQDKLNWRFQMGLYRAYYDAYIKARLHYETELEAQALEVLTKAEQIGAVNAVKKAQAILNRAARQKVRPEWRARTFELAEALYQSVRMQLSVKKYQAISVNRGANLDNLDAPLNSREVLKMHFDTIREMSSEDQRLKAIELIVQLAKLYGES
ncbi:MAG: beta-N-acetylhexosaminidase family protein [Planctomycetota bacterium]|jgi:hypothetical protein